MLEPVECLPEFTAADRLLPGAPAGGEERKKEKKDKDGFDVQRPI